MQQQQRQQRHTQRCPHAAISHCLTSHACPTQVQAAASASSLGSTTPSSAASLAKRWIRGLSSSGCRTMGEQLRPHQATGAWTAWLARALGERARMRRTVSWRAALSCS